MDVDLGDAQDDDDDDDDYGDGDEMIMMLMMMMMMKPLGSQRRGPENFGASSRWFLLVSSVFWCFGEFR